MSFKIWLLFLVMEIALSLSPGPAVFYVASQGVRGAARAVPATFGILSANAIYFTLSATSLGALVAASVRFFTIAKWAGAAYLVYLACRTLRAASQSSTIAVGSVAASAAAPAAAPNSARRRIYTGALILQLSNPKALLFFLALLPQFIDTHQPVVPQMAILAASSMLPEFGILVGYGWLANRAARASAKFGVSGNMHRWLSWIEGMGLLGCATLVLKFSRPD